MDELSSLPAVDMTLAETLIELYRTATKNRSRWDKTCKEVSGAIKPAMGTAEIATVRGVPALRLSRIVVPRFGLDEFKDDHPELYDRYLFDTVQSRLTVVKNAAPALDID